MTVSLDLLQERVQRHFKSLTHIRGNSDLPVFALEHGLSGEDLNQLRSTLRSHRKTRSLSASNWLLWVIYATEVGYDYTGQEYWSSFEEQTPGWESRDRYRIKTWFKKFQRTYNGVEPSGPWAEHFTIIAWPITHAILPVYLQRQFARALFDLRYRLASMETHDPQTIGRLLAINAHMPTTRFREFLQQEELIGRIVLALLGLGQEASEGDQPIYQKTLERIVSDLDKVRTSREWLKETRQIVSDRFKGIGRGRWPRIDRLPRDPTPRQQLDTKQLAVCPKVLLRHIGRGSWSVLFDVPSFRNVATLDTDIHSFLKTTRCSLNGGNDVKPRGWLLSGNRKGIVQSWPDTTKPLLQLEHQHPIIDHLLEAECRLSPGPNWLFRVCSDGIAQEIKGRTVRPDATYILVTTGDLPQANEAMSPCALDCRNATAFHIAIPPHVSEDLTSWLDDLGLHVARTIQVWPAGLPGRGWNGEGNSEWLTTEAPCLGVSHDHPVDAYTLRLNNGLEQVIQTDGTADPIFVRLSPLPAGIYHLTVKARRSDALEAVVSSSSAEGFMQLTVREPEPWTPGIASHSGLIVTIDPSEPNLDTFWRNEASLSVIGPENYTASLTMKLEAADDRQVLNKQVGGRFNLPITPEKWRRSFEQFLKPKSKEQELAESYLETAKGTLTIDGETLGSYSITFEHDAKPVRWVARKDRDDIFVRLVDDTGHEETKAKVYRCDLKHPLKMLPLPLDKVLTALKVEPPGSLFYAEHSGYGDAIAVSTIGTEKGFKVLELPLSLGELPRSTRAISDALHLLTRWQGARLSGFLIKIRHQKVVDKILVSVYEAVCGQNWAEAETRFRNNPKSPHAFEDLKLRVEKKNRSFADALVHKRSTSESVPIQRTRWFAEIAAHYRVCNDYKLCEFALCLASQPQALCDLPFSELDALVSQILNSPGILRGARLLALITSNSTEDTTAQSLSGAH